MKIAVVGTGYVGLVLGACLAENGSTVICVDKDHAKIATLNAGKMTIYLESFDVAAMIREVSETIKPIAPTIMRITPTV